MTVVFAQAPKYHLPHWSGMGAEVFVDCPKCTSPTARYVVDEQDVTLHCLCGYNKVVATKLQEMVIEHFDSGDDITLPKRGSKLWTCLVVLSGIAPAKSDEMTDALNRTLSEAEKLTVSQVSSQLTVLRYKGLVNTTDQKKGVAGGSTWVLTVAARKYFGG